MTKGKLLRRLIGSLSVLGAAAMLVFGETNPAATNSHLKFLVYWLSCLLLVVIAMLMAMIDLLAVRREARQAQRRLFEQTLEHIQTNPGQRNRQSAAGTDLKD